MTAKAPRPVNPIGLAELRRDHGITPDHAMALVTSRTVRGQLWRGKLVIERASLEQHLGRSQPNP